MRQCYQEMPSHHLSHGKRCKAAHTESNLEVVLTVKGDETKIIRTAAPTACQYVKIIKRWEYKRDCVLHQIIFKLESAPLRHPPLLVAVKEQLYPWLEDEFIAQYYWECQG